MITATYTGGDRLRIEARGHEIFVDQPVPEGGGDSGPTPTELFVASLAACVGYYAERFLRRHGLSAHGLSVAASYGWAEHPHRVGRIEVEVDAPGLTDAARDAFARVIEHCTVHNSLRQPPEVTVRTKAARGAAA